MRAIDRLRRSGIGIAPERTVREAAAIMESSGLGTLAVIDRGTLVWRRDRSGSGATRGRSWSASRGARRLGDDDAVTIDAAADLHDAFDVFHTDALRRLAVVNRGGHFLGIISLDGLMVDLAEDLGSLIRPLSVEIRTARRDSPVPAV